MKLGHRKQPSGKTFKKAIVDRTSSVEKRHEKNENMFNHGLPYENHAGGAAVKSKNLSRK